MLAGGPQLWADDKCFRWRVRPMWDAASPLTCCSALVSLGGNVHVALQQQDYVHFVTLTGIKGAACKKKKLWQFIGKSLVWTLYVQMRLCKGIIAVKWTRQYTFKMLTFTGRHRYVSYVELETCIILNKIMGSDKLLFNVTDSGVFRHTGHKYFMTVKCTTYNIRGNPCNAGFSCYAKQAFRSTKTIFQSAIVNTVFTVR